MPAPPDVVARLSEAFVKAATPILDAAWDRWEAAIRKEMASAAMQGATAALLQIRKPQSALEAATQKLMFDLPPPSSAAEAVSRLPLMSPQKRGAQNRVEKGRVKAAVWTSISHWSEEGLSREGVRQQAAKILGQPIKEGSLKQAIRLLKKDKKIETRNSRWYPLT